MFHFFLILKSLNRFSFHRNHLFLAERIIKNNRPSFVIYRRPLVHVPNFWGVAGSEDFAFATLPTTPLIFTLPPYHPLDFLGKISNFCHPTLLKIRFKITVTPPPPSQKWAKSKLRCFNRSVDLVSGRLSLKLLSHMTT